MRCIEPPEVEGGKYVTYYEGRVDKGGATYPLTITSEDFPEDAVLQVLLPRGA